MHCSYGQNLGRNCKKIFKCGRPGGGGVFSDFGHPRTRGGGGRGGQKRANFCGRPLWPLTGLTPYWFDKVGTRVQYVARSRYTVIGRAHPPVLNRI